MEARLLESAEQRWNRIMAERRQSLIDRIGETQPCKVDDCDRAGTHKGYCNMHYMRVTGNSNVPVAIPNPVYHGASSWGHTDAEFAYFADWRCKQNDAAIERDRAIIDHDRTHYPHLFTDTQQTAA